MKTKEELLALQKVCRKERILAAVLIPAGYAMMFLGMNRAIVLGLVGMCVAMAGIICLLRTFFHNRLRDFGETVSQRLRGFGGELRNLMWQESGLDRREFLRRLRKQRHLRLIGGYLLMQAGTCVACTIMYVSNPLLPVIGGAMICLGIIPFFQGCFGYQYQGLKAEWKQIR